MVDIKKVTKPKNSVLASEIASSATDPQFYAAMQMLPNPDPILRKLGRSQDAYDAIGYDAHVMGEIRAIRGNLLKNEWRIMPGGDSTQDIQAFELINNIFKSRPARNMTWSDLIWNLQTAIFRGFSIAEVQWQKQGNHIVPVTISDKPNRRFVFSSDHELRMLTRNNGMEGIELPDYKFLLARHMPSYDNPYGVAVYSACFWPYMFKHNGYRWFSKFVERYGIPSAIGRYPMSTHPDQQRELLNGLQSMIEDACAVVPEGTSVELLEVKSSGKSTHQEFINSCNRELSKALTSQTLGSEVTESGSRSTAEVQAKRQQGNSDADLEAVQRAMQTLCDWVTQINFPDAIAPTWQFYDEKQLSKAEAETLNVITSFLPVKTSEVYERLQLTQPEDGDDVIFHGGANAQPTPPDEGKQFNRGCNHSHHFNQADVDKLTELAAAGDEAAQATIESMTQAIANLANNAKDLDDFDDQLANILDDVETTEFEQHLGDGLTISYALGLESEQGGDDE